MAAQKAVELPNELAELGIAWNEPLPEIAEVIAAKLICSPHALLHLAEVSRFWHDFLSQPQVWERLSAARFGEEAAPAPLQPPVWLPEWSFIQGLDSGGNDVATPDDTCTDRSPAALARLADARGGVAFNTNGWVKRALLPFARWERFSYEPGAGSYVRKPFHGASFAGTPIKTGTYVRSRALVHQLGMPPRPEQLQGPEEAEGAGAGGAVLARPPQFPGWVYYALLDSPGSDVHWRRWAESAWCGLYVKAEVVAARSLLQPLPSEKGTGRYVRACGGLDPRLRFFQRGQTRLLAARDGVGPGRYRASWWLRVGRDCNIEAPRSDLDVSEVDQGELMDQAGRGWYEQDVHPDRRSNVLTFFRGTGAASRCTRLYEPPPPPPAPFTFVWIGRFARSPRQHEQWLLSLNRTVTNYDQELCWSTHQLFTFTIDQEFSMVHNYEVDRTALQGSSMALLDAAAGEAGESRHVHAPENTWFLRGDMAVLLIYNRALPTHELQQLAQAYAPRFGF
eukprot:XP_001689856.1 predicted protein [Chlamydomonas reinhardtii]